MRRKLKSKRILAADPTYQSVQVAKLINYIMEKGHKNIARAIVYDAFEIIKEKTKQNPVEVFDEALKNVGPVMEIKTRRVGGANYQIPHEVSPERRLTLSLRWLIDAARNKRGKPIAPRLADELMAAAGNEGDAVKKRETVHKMAEANRAFAHFARSYTKKL
ncbi:MAG: 30S ribosomal protein S7 [Candidatus Vogelbacteria bacterium]|nr:30S ribosomal protein S7 [Candidatus Vogelbacteria bacterium]